MLSCSYSLTKTAIGSLAATHLSKARVQACLSLQWLNRMLQGMWPYYDKAIGAAIKEAVEPMMEQYKPPGLIKKIYFSKLTFGDAPIRIDNVWVEDEGENHVLLEVIGQRSICVFDVPLWQLSASWCSALKLPASLQGAGLECARCFMTRRTPLYSTTKDMCRVAHVHHCIL